MRKLFQEKTICRLFNGACIALFFILFHYCLGQTGINKAELWDEHIYFRTDSILFNIVTIVLSLLFLALLGRLAEKLTTRKSRNLLLAAVCVISTAFSFYWVWGCKSAPQADQLYICEYADAFNQGDFSQLQEPSYMTRYPHQFGMVALLQVIFRLFGSMNYTAFQYFNAALIPLFIVSGCQIVRILSDDNVKAEVYYLFFALCCFPMYAYTSFVYGDLLTTTLSFFAVWMYLSCLKHFSWLRLGLFGITMGVCVQLRMNCLILMIALLIVMAVKLIFERGWKHLAAIAALVLGYGLMSLAVWGIYHNVRNAEIPSIPSSLIIVGGLNDDYGYAGWNNFYDYNTFAQLGDETEPALEVMGRDLRMYMDIYKNDPAYMVDFFVRKMNSQWNAPMYQSLVMNSRIAGEQAPPIKNIFQHGKLGGLIESGMKIYQLLMYGGILFLLIIRRKEYVKIERYLLLIAVFGGFLFTLMWEAKTRYALPYLFMQVPYMALGVNELVSFVQNRLQNRKPHE